MFNGLKQRLYKLRNESADKRKKVFWIWTSLIFAVVVVLWIVFGGAFSIGGNFGDSGSFREIESAWNNVKNVFGSSSQELSQAKNQINTLINYATSSSTASTTNATTTEQQIGTSTDQQTTTTNQ